MTGPELKRFEVLGVSICAVNMEDVLREIESAVLNKKKIYISSCPVGTVVECRRDDRVLRSVNSADLITPDGMPIVWIGKLKGYLNIARVYGPDLLLAVCRISRERCFRHYFYGSKPQVLIRLKERLQEAFPGLTIAGSYSPPFRKLSSEEEAENIELINKSNSDILWVGLGSPKQDLWMHQFRGGLNAPVLIGVGAAFDFISGLKKQAPGWMQKSGLEWLFRLITEPARLWRRYILGNSLFLCLFFREFFRIKKK